MAEIPKNIRVGLYESKHVLRPQVLTPGTYSIQLQTDGNSLLSTVWVKAATGTVEVKYWDYTSGDGVIASERYELNGHGVISTPQSHRIIVTRLHNKPVAEVIVSGGNVEVGLYISVISDFPVDLKGSIVDGQTANLLSDGGLPISVYNPDDGKFYLLRGGESGLSIAPQVSTPKKHTLIVASANTEQTFTFPAGTRQVGFKARGTGKILWGWDSGDTVTNYTTLDHGCVYASPIFDKPSLTLYFQSPIAGLVIEAESWS